MSERTGDWDFGCGCIMIAVVFIIAAAASLEQWYEYQQRQERIRACAQIGGWLDKAGECKPFAKAPEAK